VNGKKSLSAALLVTRATTSTGSSQQSFILVRRPFSSFAMTST